MGYLRQLKYQAPHISYRNSFNSKKLDILRAYKNNFDQLIAKIYSSESRV